MSNKIETKIPLIHSLQSAGQISNRKEELFSPPAEQKKEEDFCGNKYEGLQQVAAFLKEEGIENVSVPMPKGISSAKIEAFLKEHAPSVFLDWMSLKAKYKEHLRLKKSSPFLEDQAVFKLLEQIQTCILQAFKQNPSVLEELKPWLEEIQGQNVYLMVRSSGAEDSKKLANAGGNLSLSYVEPTLEAVTSAAAQVVASYFGIGSLKNQLEMGHNPFAAPPTLSFLVQKLIGESVGGTGQAIPVSCVLFTHEPNYSQDTFKVTTISAANGHGEGVVNNAQVATDTIFATSSSIDPKGMFVVYQNAPKPKRLAPMRNYDSGEVELQLVAHPNPDKRCLSDEMIARLLKLAKAFGKDKAYDMELVILGETIYVVQARPVIRPKAIPTYFNPPQVEGIQQTEYCKQLVVGKGSCEKIIEAGSILFANTLKEAEEAFDANKHKCVIVAQDEPKNSHPVVNFSSLGVLALFAPNYEHVQEMAGQVDATHCLFVCAQSGRVVLWDTKNSTNDCIQKGYYAFPADLSHSLPDVPQNRLTGRPPIPKKLSKALTALREAKTEAAARKALEQLKQHPLISSLKGRVKELEANRQMSADTLDILNKLSTCVDKVFAELETSLREEIPPLQRLFYIDSLSRLIGSNEQGPYTYSLLDVDTMVNRTNQAIAYQAQLKEPAYFIDFLKVQDMALSEQHAEIWQSFLLQLEIAQELTAEEKADFLKLLQQLDSYEALPQWFNTQFLPCYQPGEEVKVCRSLIAEAPKENDPFIALIEKSQVAMQELKTLLPAFANPQTINQANEVLEGLQKNTYRSEIFIIGFTTAPVVVKMMALRSMQQFVALTDEAIKTMKASPHYPDQDKLSIFRHLLIMNYYVMEVWLDYLITESNIKFPESISDKSLRAYYLKMCNKLGDQKPTDPALLRPSRDFSVQAASLASKTDYTRHVPQTLEDIFTLIHQNQLFVVSALTRNLLQKNSLAFPSLVREAIQTIENLQSGPSRYPAELLGTHFDEKSVRFDYSIPLRNHSAMISLYYDKSTKQVTLRFQMYGENRRRWDHMLFGVKAAKMIHHLDYFNPLCTEQEFVCNWTLSNRSQIQLLNPLLGSFLKDSIDGTSWNTTNILYSQAQKNLMTEQIGKQLFEMFMLNPAEDVSLIGDEYWLVFINDYLKTSEGRKNIKRLQFAPEELSRNDAAVQKKIKSQQTLINWFREYSDRPMYGYEDLLINKIEGLLDPNNLFEQLLENSRVLLSNKDTFQIGFDTSYSLLNNKRMYSHKFLKQEFELTSFIFANKEMIDSNNHRFWTLADCLNTRTRILIKAFTSKTELYRFLEEKYGHTKNVLEQTLVQLQTLIQIYRDEIDNYRQKEITNSIQQLSNLIEKYNKGV